MKYQKAPSSPVANSAVSFATYCRAPSEYPVACLSGRLDAWELGAHFHPWFELAGVVGAAAKLALALACSFVAPDYIEVGAKTVLRWHFEMTTSRQYRS